MPKTNPLESVKSKVTPIAAIIERNKDSLNVNFTPISKE
jgi:hypothetical protein